MTINRLFPILPINYIRTRYKRPIWRIFKFAINLINNALNFIFNYSAKPINVRTLVCRMHKLMSKYFTDCFFIEKRIFKHSYTRIYPYP